MEESVRYGLDHYLTEVLGIETKEPEEYSPLVLAYIGDCVYDLIIKTMVVSEGNCQVKKMHQKTSALVQASAQSRMMRILQPELTEEEHTVYRRGRNTKTVTPAKNQSISDYRRATGFEALIGWLYLRKDWERMTELVKLGLDSIKGEEAGKQEAI